GGGVAALVKVLFDDVFSSAETEKISGTWLIIFGIPFLFLLKSIFRYIQANLIRRTAEGVGATLRTRLISKYLDMDFAFHTKSRSGSGGLMSRVLNDVQNIV